MHRAVRLPLHTRKPPLTFRYSLPRPENAWTPQPPCLCKTGNNSWFTMFDQPYTELIFIGLAFRSIGFLVRDELVLRALFFIGSGFDIAFYMLQDPAIWGSVLTNTVLVVINISMISIIILERSTLFMSAKEKYAFENFKTLSPGQFRRINRLAKWRIATEDTVLLREDERAGQLFFLETERFVVRKKGQEYEARGPAFVGEIMLLQGGAASATVIAPKGAVYAEWSRDQIQKAMSKSQSLENALVARFGHDLADKVRQSVPLSAPVQSSHATSNSVTTART